MEEAGQQKAVTAAFPPPPSFWKHFSQHNLDKLEKLKQESQAGQDGKKRDWTPAALSSLEVPPELQCLIPPELPEREYLLFGESQLLAPNPPSLEEQGIEQLYPSNLTAHDETGKRQSSHAFYLTKIAKSLMLNFLEFIGILAICPEQFEAKLDDIRNLFINAHHLLNLYRPHQARESLILMMEKQLQKSREEIQQMDEMKDKVEEFLAKLKSEGHGAQDPELAQANGVRDVSDVQRETRAEEFQDMWKVLNDMDDS